MDGKRYPRLLGGLLPTKVGKLWPLSPLLYVLVLEPLLRRLRDRTTNPALRGVPFAGLLTARVSAFADDITVFVSRRLDIKAVKKAVSEYERIAGAKVNFDKSEGLRLGAWRGSNTRPGPFRWSVGPVRILGVWFGPDLQLERNWNTKAPVGSASRFAMSRPSSLGRFWRRTSVPLAKLKSITSSDPRPGQPTGIMPSGCA